MSMINFSFNFKCAAYKIVVIMMVMVMVMVISLALVYRYSSTYGTVLDLRNSKFRLLELLHDCTGTCTTVVGKVEPLKRLRNFNTLVNPP